MRSLAAIGLACIATALPVAAGDRAQEERWSLEEACRVADQIGREIEDLAGFSFKQNVPLRLYDRKGLSKRLREHRRARIHPATERMDELVLKLLGMAAGDEDLVAASHRFDEARAVAFYDPYEGTLSLAGDSPPGVARIVLAAELAQALHDQHFQFAQELERLAGNGDARRAHRAIVEGTGSALALQWVISHAQDLTVEEIMSAKSVLSKKAVVDSPFAVWRPRMAVAARGESFLRRTNIPLPFFGSPRPADIRQAFEDPPRSMEQVLHPVKYWKPSRRDEPRRVVLAPETPLPAGWRVVHEDTFGETLLAILTMPAEERGRLAARSLSSLQSAGYTTHSAEGWGGDRFALLEGCGAHVLRLVTRWDSPQDAREFRSAVLGVEHLVLDSLAHLPGYAEAPRGLEVELGAEDEVLVTSWIGIDRASALRLGGSMRARENQ